MVQVDQRADYKQAQPRADRADHIAGAEVAIEHAVQFIGGNADTLIGQPDLDANGENRWDRVESDSLCWPYGLSWSSSRLGIADSGNNRVVIWGEDQ